MKIRQGVVKSPDALEGVLASLAAIEPNLVLVFGAIGYFADKLLVERLRQQFPAAVLLGCSTAGEVSNAGVEEGSCVVTALRTDKIRITATSTRLQGMEDSLSAGKRIGTALAHADLKAVLLFAPGVGINGSALVAGLAGQVGAVPITGGLAGDGGAFRRTFTLGRDGSADDAVVAIGLGGADLRIGQGSFGGWETFGLARKVTRAAGNVLYELDGEPALEIYKRYLGQHAANLPASGLLFPFAMLGEDLDASGLIRTILGVDEAAGSLTLAGAIDPQGYLKLMHASTDRLVEGAETAAGTALGMLSAAGHGEGEEGEALAVLVSCVGRKLVMGDRVDEEVEAVGDVLGQHVTLAGFYSYGEICPSAPGLACHLHNQTMTITVIREA